MRYSSSRSPRKTILLFNGVDEQFLVGRLMGADGGIGGTYAVMPELYLTLDRMIRKNDVEPAQKLQFAMNEIISKMLNCRGSLFAVAKHILNLQGINIGDVRAPLTSVCQLES